MQATEPSSTNAVARTNTAAKSRWPLIIIGLLGSHVLAMVVAVVIATHDPSFAVAPDYYRRAVNWDQEQAALRSSQKLGWQIALEASEQVDPIGRRAVSFVLHDAHGQAIPGATLAVEYFHHSHGDQDKVVTMTPDAADASRFSGLLPMRYAGEWEFHFTATAAGQTYVVRQTQVLSNAHTARGPA